MLLSRTALLGGRGLWLIGRRNTLLVTGHISSFSTTTKMASSMVEPREPEVNSEMSRLYVSKEPGVTFKYDNDLPSLPVPPLKQTLDRYLDWAKPHLTDNEYTETKRKVEEFGLGVGQELHAKLVEKANTERNWLEEWWLKYAYLSVREPLLPTMNTTGPQTLSLSLWPPSEENANKYGALYLWTTLGFFNLLRDEKLRPQASNKGQKFSMEQFRRLFNTARIPGHPYDSVFTCWKTKAEGDVPMHIIVLCNGHIWNMIPFDFSGAIMTPPELEQQLQYIREQSDSMGEGLGIASLTCDHRESWAENRHWLMSISERNHRNIELIESSIIGMAQDNSCPENFEQACWEGLCGDIKNRWADKSFSIVNTRNGYGTTNNDHTPFDAMVTVVMAHYQHLYIEEMEGVWKGSEEIRDFPMPKLLEFDVDSKIINGIYAAREYCRPLLSNICVTFRVFEDYGKDWMKSQKLHPDAFVQMSLQLAYIRLNGKPAPTYETATTRQFYHGRTETMRSCTIEAVEFAHSMLSQKATLSEKKNKLVCAVERHKELMSECQKCEGIDRHLMGLGLIAMEAGMETPQIFTDLAYTKSGGGGNYVISSSTTGYTPIMGGVAAMVPHGYGCFYSMMPNKIQFFISNFTSTGETNGADFADAIYESLRDMKDVLLAPQANL